MARLAGTRIIQPIVPSDSRDNYPTHTERYGHGGYKSVFDLIERDSIPIERQKVGMAVYIVSEFKIFILLICSDSLDDSCWRELDFGPSGSVVVQPLAPENPEEGLLWLNTSNGKIMVFSNSVWEVFVFSSQMIDDDGELTLNGGYF